MSKIDSGDVQRSVMLDMERAKSDVKNEGGRLVRASTEDIIALLQKMMEDQKSSIAQLVKLDFAQTNGQLRQILADELVKIMQNVPGFVAPNLSRPPSPDEMKQLTKQLQGMENQGLLEKYDAVAKARPEDVRGGMMTPDSSPNAKNWSTFVQAATSAQGPQESLPLSKDGVREGQSPMELLGNEIPRREQAEPLMGAGLRSPARAGEPFAGLNNKQKLDIMTAGFGRELAMALKDLGVRDPVALLKLAANPEARETLAQRLGMTRGQLTVTLARAEMLGIGPGRQGEQALRPQHLPALQQANIVTTKHLAVVHSLDKTDFSEVFTNVRQNFSGFAKAMTGERPILKKDLQHWAKTASRRKSDLLDASWEEMPRRQGDAEEMIMGWYLQHWAELEDQREQKARDELNKEKLKEAEKHGLSLPEAKYDPTRDDGLICFWIERPNLAVDRPTLTEMVYVCLDPKTGLIDMKQKE
ncbi:MAG: hypothetical protein IT381_23845 [Deltaproteobacteria bacterium]|nr:hypothetical protein [Deltaproteobacteria bacterium]